MARPTHTSSFVVPPKLQLAPPAIQKGIERLGERLAELEAFDVRTLHDGESPQLTQLETAIQDTLERCFGEHTSAYNRFYSASTLHWNPSFFDVAGQSRPDYVTPTQKNIRHAVALLKEAKRQLQEDLVDHGRESPSVLPEVLQHESKTASNRVFVVHGHDESATHGLARFLEKLGLEAIILKEQPDQGRTIIEKFEAAAGDVGFAVVLLTPDDLGGSVNADTPNARARQNVIFELGYFAGKLGRGRVCLLRKGHVEIPSDLYGVIYTDMDPADGWQTKLVKELKAAKLDFDANRLWQ